ncbi:facilitated trehalose transporter Tret1-like [Amphibalanus amphitrite]|uniref:facilitated trehalose transporter Tret1-like n=1 Tax=Amphibalanus amphitrite TaxID=1232801 RepID=UPI001C905127|nr:facilitated trehalose transporter Tret1-like [Amphibalanus amphitrite]
MTSSTLELISPRPYYTTQVLASLAVAMGQLAVGLGKGYSSPALQSLAGAREHGGLAISAQQGSWVASLSLLGALVGGLPSGLALRLGRRRLLAAVSVPFAAAWWLAAGAGSVWELYAAAFISGICSSVVAVVTPVYVSEIAQPAVRGSLCSLTKVATSVGLLLSYSLGVALDWRRLAMVASAGPLLLLLGCCCVPETPSFLMFRGRDREARAALQWLRGPSADISSEHDVMRANIVYIKQEQPSCGDASPEQWRALVRPVLVTTGLMFLQKFSGVHAFSFYGVTILDKVLARASAQGAAAVVALLQILAGLTSSVLIDTVGRRPLLMVSSALMSVSLAGFGTFVYVVERLEWTSAQQAPFDWVPMSCVLVCQVAFALGVGPISWLLIGELFPLRQRGLGALAASVSYGCAFVSVKTFVDLERWLGLCGVFWLYAVVSLFCLAFILVFVPETKGRELEEMEERTRFV